MKKFYITTTLPYVNSDPHIGFAAEIIRADIIARYKRLEGFDVFFNTGTDEHGIKIYRKATETGTTPQKYVDEYSEKFKALKETLNLTYNSFIRTTDPTHMSAAQEFWRRCLKAGDIYKKNYKIKYCIGCELEKTESELVDGKCPEHPNLTIESIDEENYFFRFSRFQKTLLDLYADESFVIPQSRLNEIKAFVSRGLEDFSISRLKQKMPWGIPVPDDKDHVMYVWFDALVNYISAIGWPNNVDSFNQWWPAVQYCGKDNLRQQSAMWQAMLASAGIPFSKKIIVNGFVISDGKKMSKSLGNTISPFDVISEYGTDTLRYIVARRIHSFEDTDITMDRIKEIYNGDLANGLGNLLQRVVKMAVSYEVTIPKDGPQNIENAEKTFKECQEFISYKKHLDSFDINQATEQVWILIGKLDSYIQENKPFSKIKVNPEEAKKDVRYLLEQLYGISTMLIPILPETSTKMRSAITENKVIEPLFLRKE